MKKPRDIKIYFQGQWIVLMPQSVGSKEIRRLRDQLNRHLDYMEFVKKKVPNEK